MAAPLFSALGPISLGPLLEQKPTQKARAAMSNTLVDLLSSAFHAPPLKNADVVKWMVPVTTILEIGKLKLSE